MVSLVVSKVITNGKAYLAGIKVDDVIVSCNHIEIDSKEVFLDILKQAKDNDDDIELILKRDNLFLTFIVDSKDLGLTLSLQKVKHQTEQHQDARKIDTPWGNGPISRASKRKKGLWVIVPFALLLFFFYMGSPSKNSPAPNHACDMLTDIGLRANKWHKANWTDGYTYVCLTDYVDIEPKPSTGLSNNIAYYVTGSAFDVGQYKLVTNFNVPNEQWQAMQKTVDSASALIERSLNVIPPQEILQAIKDKKTASWYVNEHRVDVKTIPWNNDKGGFEIKVLVAGNPRSSGA